MRTLAVVSCALLAGCPKGGGAPEPQPAETAPETAAPEVAVHDPAIVCLGPEDERTAFTFDLTYAEGCPVIPSEPGGEVHDVELDVDGTPAKIGILNPIDLAAEQLTWVSAGCGARVHFVGAIGTLDLEFAALDSSNAGGTGTWTPAGGASCAITLEGQVSNYQRREPEEEEEEY